MLNNLTYMEVSPGSHYELKNIAVVAVQKHDTMFIIVLIVLTGHAVFAIG